MFTREGISSSAARVFLAMSLLLALAVPAAAQLDRGSITGQVTDSSGAVVPNVKVAARNEATNGRFETISGGAGEFRISNLQVGNYEVTFEASGFKKSSQSGVRVGASEVMRVDMRLEVGSAAESIEVKAEITALTTDTPEMGATLTNRSLVDLPLTFAGSRLPDAFAFKTLPGVMGFIGASSVNGSSWMSKDTLVDGATVSTYRSGDPRDNAISVEAMEEFKIQSASMSAEYGRTQSGVFNYIMKSGTNQIHGSGYAALRNEALNANTFVNNFRGQPRSLDRRQNLAGSFGGPVYIPKVYDGKNRTFFYGSFEYYNENLKGFGAPTVTVPQPEFYDGNLSRLLGAATGMTDALGRPVLRGAVYDPTTFRQLDGGRYIGDVFPGNIIPVSRISRVSQNLNAIAKKYYLPTVKDASGISPLTNNAVFLINNSPHYSSYQYSIKADHNFSAKNRFSGSFSNRYAPKLLSSGGTVPSQLWNADFDDGGPLSQGSRQEFGAWMARVADDYTISPRVLNHFTAFYNRSTNPFKTAQAATDGAALLGIKGLKTEGVPGIDWGGGPLVTLSAAGNSVSYFQAYESIGMLDTVSFSVGRHFMKAGFDERRYHFNNHGSAYPIFRFNARATAIPNEAFSGNLTGYSFASYLLGINDSVQYFDENTVGGRRSYYALFLQDDFKVNSRLTLNIGIRWDIEPRITEANDRLSGFDPTVIDPANGRLGATVFTGNCSQCTGSRSFGSTSWNEVAPRFGLAYRLNERWVARGGYGFFYEGESFNGGFGGGAQTNGFWNFNPDAITPWKGTYNWDDPWPTNRRTPPSYDISYATYGGGSIYKYGLSPYTQQWNFSLQNQLTKTLMAEAAYVGSKGTRLRVGELDRINQVPAWALSKYGRQLNDAIRSEADAAKYGIPYPYAGFAGTVASALRQFPQVVGNSTLGGLGSPLGFSNYNSLQLSLNKRFSDGLTANVNYVWSKTLTNVYSSNVGENGNRPLDYYNLRLEKSVVEYDYPHAFKTFVQYELPFGHGKKYGSNMNKFVNALAGGWGINAILNYFSGQPLVFATSTSPYSGGWNGATNRPNVAAGTLMAPFDKSQFNLANTNAASNTYLNKSLFTDPAPLTLGTGARTYTSARGYPTLNEDFGLQKVHQFGERVRWQLRADFLNAFNRQTPGGIITNTAASNFGQVTSISGNRQIQLLTRLDF